jgi:PAS domain S-box-containing protein
MAEPDADLALARPAGAESGAENAGAAAADSESLAAHAAGLERAYESLIEDSVVPILITDYDGKVLRANAAAAQLAGVAKEALVGEPLNSSQLSIGLRVLHTALPAARQNPELGERLETRLSNRNLSLDLHTRHTMYGGQPAIRWLVHDRTALQELERVRDEQVYMVVHDVRNPLGNIISSLELLKDSLQDPTTTPAPGALVNIALRSARRISLLVESLMDMTRMEAGQFTLNTTTARLDTLIEHALEFVKPTADRKRILLRTEIEPNLPPVLINVNMIERVVVNLLDNACKFVEPGQAVTISVRLGHEADVHISVHDDGPGIPPEDQPRIFEKFSRGARAGGLPSGTGLGLAFCKLAVETHGGRIWVESEVGKGSLFTFTLPIGAS